MDDTHKLIDATTPERYSRKDRLGERDLAPRRPKEVAAMRGRLSALTATLVRDQATAGEAAASSDRIPMLEMLGCLTASAADRKYVDSF
ncbi:MAG: hypothetical protein JXX28_13155 [Deltaproteobacteria bacterium]|nr:hypothetical protein [Deltaproteobacteria bacterium]